MKILVCIIQQQCENVKGGEILSGLGSAVNLISIVRVGGVKFARFLI
jgi:hypothetical protein